MKYLVVGSGGPGFGSQEEAMAILEHVVMPSFDYFTHLEKEGYILGGGLPVGDRAFIFMAEASSNDELDRLLRDIPMWGTLDWEVTPLQTFSARAEKERQALEDYKKDDSG